MELKPNTYVVYPPHGVGLVEATETIYLNDIAYEYFVIYFSYSAMHIKLPINENSTKLLRFLSSEKQVKGAIKVLKAPFKIAKVDWKLRFQNLQNALKEGNLADLAQIVHSLFYRHSLRELPIQEKKIYDQAFLSMIEEIHLILEKDSIEVEKMLLNALQNNLSFRELLKDKKHPGVENTEDFLDLEEDIAPSEKKNTPAKTKKKESPLPKKSATQSSAKKTSKASTQRKSSKKSQSKERPEASSSD